MNWCLQGVILDRKRHHGNIRARYLADLPIDVLDARVQTLEAPPAALLTDEELDAAVYESSSAGADSSNDEDGAGGGGGAMEPA